MKEITETKVMTKYQAEDGMVFFDKEVAIGHEKDLTQKKERAEHKLKIESYLKTIEITALRERVPYGECMDTTVYGYHWYNVQNDKDRKALVEYYGEDIEYRICDNGIYCVENNRSYDEDCNVCKLSDMNVDLINFYRKLGYTMTINKNKD